MFSKLTSLAPYDSPELYRVQDAHKVVDQFIRVNMHRVT